MLSAKDCFHRGYSPWLSLARRAAGSGAHYLAHGCTLNASICPDEQPCDGSLRVFSGYSLGGFRVPTGCLPDGLRVVSGYSEGGLLKFHHSSFNLLHSARGCAGAAARFATLAPSQRGGCMLPSSFPLDGVGVFIAQCVLAGGGSVSIVRTLDRPLRTRRWGGMGNEPHMGCGVAGVSPPGDLCKAASSCNMFHGTIQRRELTWEPNPLPCITF